MKVLPARRCRFRNPGFGATPWSMEFEHQKSRGSESGIFFIRIPADMWI